MQRIPPSYGKGAPCGPWVLTPVSLQPHRRDEDKSATHDGIDRGRYTYARTHTHTHRPLPQLPGSGSL